MQPFTALNEEKPHTFLDAGKSQKTPINAIVTVITFKLLPFLKTVVIGWPLKIAAVPKPVEPSTN